MDLNHAQPFAHPTRIWAGGYADCAGAAIVIVAAGTNQKPDENRLDLIKKNSSIFQKIIPEVVRHAANAILLIATNPVDVLTYASWKLSGFPPNRVIGSGTILDTARFRYLLGRHFGIDPQSVHAYIIGEHGDSECRYGRSRTSLGYDCESFVIMKISPTMRRRCNQFRARRGPQVMTSCG